MTGSCALSLQHEGLCRLADVCVCGVLSVLVPKTTAPHPASAHQLSRAQHLVFRYGLYLP